MYKTLLLSIFTVFIVISGCSNKSTYSRKPVTNIQITPSNKIVTLGNDFTVNFHTKIKEGKIKKIDLLIDNQIIVTTTDLDFIKSFSTKNLLPGNHTIQTIAEKTDGVKASNYSTILIASDIVPKKSSFKIVNTYPHNPKYFTEGFEFHNGLLYEGTGNNGSSYLISYNWKSGKIYSSVSLDDQYFGEGITILNDKIYQLTYKSKKGFIYDLNTFEKKGEFSFSSTEGWGMSNDGKYLIMSDGTSKVNFIDPSNFQIVKTIEICDNNGVLNNINELEYVDGIIYANIWMSNIILKIEASSGKVLAYINMEGLLNYVNNSSIDVLNGIAYNKSEDLFYVTGKLWPKMFAVSFE